MVFYKTLNHYNSQRSVDKTYMHISFKTNRASRGSLPLSLRRGMPLRGSRVARPPDLSMISSDPARADEALQRNTDATDQKLRNRMPSSKGPIFLHPRVPISRRRFLRECEAKYPELRMVKSSRDDPVSVKNAALDNEIHELPSREISTKPARRFLPVSETF